MEKNFITDDNGVIQSVILPYEYFKEFESVFEDFLLGKILQDAENDEDLSIEEAKTLLGI